MWDLKQNKSICIYPFVHKHFSLENNEERLCCMGTGSYGINGQDNTKIRKQVIQDMQAGNAIKGCESCYSDEKDGFVSMRIEKTKQWIKRYGEPTQVDMQWYDIRNDDTCNLKCKYCGPYASTMWKKELGITAKPKKQIDLDDDEIANCKVWYQAGGEPFLNQPFFNIVERFTQINPDVEMTINSNMSNVSDKWLKLLSKLQNLHIISSIDATGDLLTYLRYPVTEEKITNSIKKLYDQTDATIMAGPVLSNLGIGHLLKTMKYLIEQLKDASMIDIGLVNSPDEFSIKAIPYNIRKDYLDIVYKTKQLCKQSIKSIRVVKILDGLDKIVQNLESLDYDKTLHLKLQNTCTLQDNRRSLKLADVDPYLHSWVYDKYIT